MVKSDVIPKSVRNGQRITFHSRTVEFVCCDCGLSHVFQFRIKGKTLSARIWAKQALAGGKGGL